MSNNIKKYERYQWKNLCKYLIRFNYYENKKNQLEFKILTNFNSQVRP